MAATSYVRRDGAMRLRFGAGAASSATTCICLFATAVIVSLTLKMVCEKSGAHWQALYMTYII